MDAIKGSVCGAPKALAWHAEHLGILRRPCVLVTRTTTKILSGAYARLLLPRKGRRIWTSTIRHLNSYLAYPVKPQHNQIVVLASERPLPEPCRQSSQVRWRRRVSERHLLDLLSSHWKSNGVEGTKLRPSLPRLRGGKARRNSQHFISKR